MKKKGPIYSCGDLEIPNFSRHNILLSFQLLAPEEWHTFHSEQQRQFRFIPLPSPPPRSKASQTRQTDEQTLFAIVFITSQGRERKKRFPIFFLSLFLLFCTVCSSCPVCISLLRREREGGGHHKENNEKWVSFLSPCCSSPVLCVAE